MADHTNLQNVEPYIKRFTVASGSPVRIPTLKINRKKMEGTSTGHAGLPPLKRLTKDQERKQDSHIYTFIKVARDEDFAQQIGRDIYFDLVDHDKVKCFRVRKHMIFNHFKEKFAKEFGIPMQFLRFWIWHLYRPWTPLTPLDEINPDLRPIAPPEQTKDDLLLFFKLYDPVKQELPYVGRLFVKGFGKLSEILMKLNEMAGYDREEQIILYAEMRVKPFVVCKPIDKGLSYQASRLKDGDIICFQKANRFPDVPSYFSYLSNRPDIHFRSLDKQNQDDFCLEMSRLDTYDDVVERVAQQLGLDDPSKIRLTPQDYYSQQPKPQPIKYGGVKQLSDMGLDYYNETSAILYYEVLDIPLQELEGLKILKVAFNHATKDEVVIHTIRLPKQSTVGDFLDHLKTKVELSHPNAELRLLEVFYHRIYKVFPRWEKIENIDDEYWTFRAEEIPEDEKNLGPHDRLILVCHFTKNTHKNLMAHQIQNFGDPFFLVIHEGETLADIKVRIQHKLQVPDEEFSKWKFAFLPRLGPLEYLQDSDIVSSRFQRRDVYGAWEQYLGLEHADNAHKGLYIVKKNRHTFEKLVKIL